MKIAICYHGLLRGIKNTIESHSRNIYDVLDENNINYDIFLHTWIIDDETLYDTKYKHAIASDINNLKLLNCKKTQVDNQADFLKNLDFSQYFYEQEWTGTPPRTNNQKGEWIPQLLKNHLCALESLKRVYKLIQDSEINYDYILCIRPDGLLTNKIDINFFKDLSENEIAVPNNQRYNGYCDQLAIGKVEYMKYYMMRIDEAPEFRKTKHRIDAESYCRYIIDKYAKVKFIHYNYSKLIRN